MLIKALEGILFVKYSYWLLDGSFSWIVRHDIVFDKRYEADIGLPPCSVESHGFTARGGNPKVFQGRSSAHGGG
jgi:hypothetical protein